MDADVAFHEVEARVVEEAADGVRADIQTVDVVAIVAQQALGQVVADEAVDPEDQYAGAAFHRGVRLGGQTHVGDDAHFLRQAAALHVQTAVVLTGDDLQRAFATGDDQRRGAQHGARLLIVLGIQHARAPDDQLALAEVAERPGYGSVTARTRLLISWADLCHRISPSAALRRPK